MDDSSVEHTLSVSSHRSNGNDDSNDDSRNNGKQLQENLSYRVATSKKAAPMFTSFEEYWKEFLLISITSTEAATKALQVLAGSKASIDLLHQRQSQCRVYQQTVVDVLTNSSSTEIPIDLLNESTNLFGDFYSLNQIFVPQNDRECDQCGIDVERVERFHGRLNSLIERLPPEEAMKISGQIFESIEKMGETVKRGAEKTEEGLVDESQIRFLPILAGFPLFDTFGSMGQRALTEIHRCVGQLNPKLKGVLRSWYSNFPLSVLRRHLELSQQLITLQVLETMNTDGVRGLIDRTAPVLRHAFSFLQLLFECNSIRRERQQVDIVSPLPSDPELASLEPSEFINEAVNATEDMIKTDFVQHHQRRPPSSFDFQLLEHSFILDAATKSWYFLQHAIVSQNVSAQGSWLSLLSGGSPYLILRVRRDEIVHDALRKLTATVSETELRKPLKVVFDDEEGVDEGGVTKEFFQLLVEKLFCPDYGMFEYYDDSRLYWINGSSLESSLQFELIGVVLGLAIYNGVILDLHFPMCVYKKLLNAPVGISDLAEFKPAVANSLRQVLRMSAEDLQSASLTFTLEVQCFGHTEERPLGKHECDDPVTLDNREEYVELYLKYILQDSIEPQFRAMKNGLMKCCGDKYLTMLFQPTDLMLVLCGSDEYDLESLESVTKYQDGYTKDSETVKHFWEVVHSLTDEEKKKLLFFVTGSDRVPIGGLKSLNFFIGRQSSDSDRLPTAHTCFNYLLLPDYQDRDKLRTLLLRAIQHYIGFGLR